MRLSLTLLIPAALALSGCVVATPVPVPAPVVPAPVTPLPAPAPLPPAPMSLDAASRAAAQVAINAEMQKRLPGVNVTPYTSCIMANATTAELIDIAQMSRAGVRGTADSVAAIVKRPATTACISTAAKTS